MAMALNLIFLKMYYFLGKLGDNLKMQNGLKPHLRGKVQSLKVSFKVLNISKNNFNKNGLRSAITLFLTKLEPFS